MRGCAFRRQILPEQFKISTERPRALGIQKPVVAPAGIKARHAQRADQTLAPVFQVHLEDGPPGSGRWKDRLIDSPILRQKARRVGRRDPRVAEGRQHPIDGAETLSGPEEAEDELYCKKETFGRFCRT